MPNRTAIIFLLLAAPALASTEEAVRKVFAARCWSCHAQTAMGKLRLDSREAMLRGGQSGTALVPGDAAKSRLYAAVARSDSKVKAMPPGRPIPADEVRSIR